MQVDQSAWEIQCLFAHVGRVDQWGEQAAVNDEPCDVALHLDIVHNARTVLDGGRVIAAVTR